MKKIAFDVMGGDYGVQEAVKGAMDFVKEYRDVELHLYGKEDEINKFLVSHKNIKVVHCEDEITMEDKAMAFRTKPEASMVKAVNAVKNGEADAVLSSGSTGTFLTSNYLLLRTIKGIKKPGLCVLFPSVEKNKNKIVMDVGANTENNAIELYQFAQMGKVYAKAMFDLDSPRVALLSNGTEDKKGTPTSQEAFKLIKEDYSINFVGNVEPKTVLDDDCDILVCDGWGGNVLMKTMEGTAKGMNKIIKRNLKSGILSSMGGLLAKGGFKKVKKDLSPEEVGGSILLGVNGIAVKAQGASMARGYFGGLRQTYILIKKDIINVLKAEMENE